MHDKHTSSADSDEGSGTGVQIAFLVILLLIFFALVGSIVYMTLQVMRYRKETTETYTAFNAMNTGEEMITHDTSHLQKERFKSLTPTTPPPPEEIELHAGASRETSF